MKTRKYKLAVQVVGTIINEWDPYSLLAIGCPNDEFDSEIAAVVKEIPRIKSRQDVVFALSRVFSNYFEPSRFTPDACSDVGTKLFKALSDNGLIEGRS